MKIAVTGATGFVGRYVVNELASRSIEPVLVIRPGARRAEIPAKCQVIELDIKSHSEKAFELMGRPQTLIHLAWGGLPNYMSLHHFSDELPAHYQFLSSLVKAGLNNLVAVGTCFEYGMQSGSLAEMMETRPTNPYGYAKDALRRQLQFLQQECPFNFTWGRMFYLYGDGHAPTSIWSQVQSAMKAKALEFKMSGGEQLRDYMHIAAAARAIVMLALTGADNGIVNICTGKPISVRRLVETWMEQGGWQMNLKLGHFSYPTYEPMAFWGNDEKLAACLATSQGP